MERSEAQDAADLIIGEARRILSTIPMDNIESAISMTRAVIARLERVEWLLTATPTETGRSGARKRVLNHFLSSGVGVPVSREELGRVSGIQEWGRRIRELRVEEGWDIRYENGHYRLMADTPDTSVANSWLLANSIRKKPSSARDRILEYLIARKGQVVTSEQLSYVSGVQEHGRQLRELRTEFGFRITSHIDRPELRTGEYILESDQPTLSLAERRMSDTLRTTVLERDGFRCVICHQQSGPNRVLGVYSLPDDFDLDTDADPEDFVTLCDFDKLHLGADQRKELLKRRRRRIEIEDVD